LIRSVDIKPRFLDVFADQYDPGVNQRAYRADKFSRGSVIDRNDDDAGNKAAPVAHDPFRAVLAPEDDLVSLFQSGGCQSHGKTASRASNLLIRMSADAIAVVVYEELAADGDEVPEEVDQRLALHSRIIMTQGSRLRASGTRLLEP
jgi:hypothetical protein